MKVILSRKGFDSSFGGYPSPILPDKTMISLPIPHEDSISYSNLKFDNNKTYYDFMKGLKPEIKFRGKRLPLTPKTTCHLDPDVYKDVILREKGWKPLFGQIGAAQTHLENHGVKKGDIFLFFGWFRRTIEEDGHYSFKSDSQGLHIIFAYFQIDTILKRLDTKIPAWMKYHPHVSNFRRNYKNNTMYIASDSLSWDNSIPGAGTFNFRRDLVLTKEGYSRSKWNLPECFKNVKISYHSEKSWNPHYFQSTVVGQEFVIQENDAVEAWVKELISKNYT